MKSLMILAVLLWSVGASAVCFQTFNTYGPFDAPDVEFRLKASLDQFRVDDFCDHFSLQEVWDEDANRLVSSYVNQGFQGYTDLFLENDKNIGLQSFTAGQVSYASIHTWSVNYDGTKDEMRRILGIGKGLQISLVQYRDLPEPIAVVNLHMHHREKSIRMAQILELVEWRVQNWQYKLVVLGDFNFTPDSIEYGLLKNLLHLRDTYAIGSGGYTKGSCTYCARNNLVESRSNRVLDYIFYSEMSTDRFNFGITAAYLNMISQTDVEYSDHYGVRAYLYPARGVYDPKSFEYRRALAIGSLSEAIDVLKRREKSMYRGPERLAMSYLSALVENNSTNEFYQYFTKGL